MKKFILFFFICICFFHLSSFAQITLYQKSIDSAEVKIVYEKLHKYTLLACVPSGCDTIWRLPEGFYGGPIYDAKFHNDNLWIIILDYPMAVCFVFKKETVSWRMLKSTVLTSVGPTYPCQAEILGDGLVRLRQERISIMRTHDAKGKNIAPSTETTVLVKYDTETGDELSRTTEKQ